MHLLKTFDPTTTFDPMNEGQVSHLAWTYPNGYWPSMYNRVPDTSQLQGLGSASSIWAGLPSWGQALAIGGVSAVIGYAAMAKFGTGYIKPALRKVGINLAGPRTRRYRRSR